MQTGFLHTFTGQLFDIGHVLAFLFALHDFPHQSLRCVVIHVEVVVEVALDDFTNIIADCLPALLNMR